MKDKVNTLDATFCRPNFPDRFLVPTISPLSRAEGGAAPTTRRRMSRRNSIAPTRPKSRAAIDGRRFENDADDTLLGVTLGVLLAYRGLLPIGAVPFPWRNGSGGSHVAMSRALVFGRSPLARRALVIPTCDGAPMPLSRRRRRQAVRHVCGEFRDHAREVGLVDSGADAQHERNEERHSVRHQAGALQIRVRSNEMTLLQRR